MIPGPAAHDEISRIRISGMFLLDAAAEISDELEVERLRQTAGDLALRFGEVSAVGVEGMITKAELQTRIPLVGSCVLGKFGETKAICQENVRVM